MVENYLEVFILRIFDICLDTEVFLIIPDDFKKH